MRVEQGGVRRWLLPAAEDDLRFREELDEAARQGLWLIGAAAVALPAFMLLAWLSLGQLGQGHGERAVAASSVMAAGAATLAGARVRWIARRARAAGIAAILVYGALLVWFSTGPAEDHFGPGYVAVCMLVGVGALPLRPLQTLGMGIALSVWHAVSDLARNGTALDELTLIPLVLSGTAVSALLYSERMRSHAVREKARKANEYLCLAQTRVVLSENAASLGRLAATLAHELNSPLGVLASAVDTALALSSRIASAPPAKQEPLLGLQEDLRDSIRTSIARLQQVIDRIHRLAALDEADFESVDLNELIRETAELVETHANEIKLKYDLHPLPALTCQAQQLGAVFHNVLTNAVKATGGKGHIRIWTGPGEDGHAEIRIEDDGCGIPEEELSEIFEPGFKVSGNRASGSNWSLFSCRQIVHGHGGEIYMTSKVGRGSSVVIRLPL